MTTPTHIDMDTPLVSDHVSEFMSYLIDTHAVGDASSLAYALEKPWKYRDEYNRFMREKMAGAR